MQDLIFTKYEDHLIWEKYVEYISSALDIADAEKQLIIEDYKFLKKELGTDFLARKKQGIHLLKDWLWNKGHNSSEVRWLANSLRYFKENDCNYFKLLGKVLSDKTFNTEAFPFLLAGDSLRKAGFEVVFEPETEFSKKPDILIKNKEDHIYIEVSKLNESEARREIGDTYHTLFDIFTRITPIIPFGGKIHRNIEDGEYDTIQKLLINKRHQAIEIDNYIEINLDETNGLIHCMVAPWSQKEHLDSWVEQNGFSGTRGSLGQITGQHLNFNETSRIIGKVRKEIKQIPPNYPGIVYIPVTPMYFLSGMFDFDKNMDALKAGISEYSNLIGICIYSHLGYQSEPVLYREFDFMQRKMVHKNIQQDAWFLLNHECQFRFLTETILGLHNACSYMYE